jgi:hypothetical protein
MTLPTVCVAIPVKNGREYIAEAIESVLAQEGVELSVCVLDNRSSDDSLEIARGYTSDPRVTADRNPVDVFYYGSLNRILARTEAEYFVPFAADDVMYPGNLERKVRALRETGAGFAHSSSYVIDGAGRKGGLAPDHTAAPALVAAPQFFERIAPYNGVSCQSVLARADALRGIGGFDGRSFYAGDWLTWMRLSLRWAVATIGDPLIGNRVHADAGTLASNASGLHGRDVPLTLDRVFLDEAMPEAWLARRDRMVAVANAHAASVSNGAGITRVADGWAAYMLMARALARLPLEPRLREAYLALVAGAGLCPPQMPAEAIAAAPRSPQDTAALAAAIGELGALVSQLVIAVDGDGLDDAVALLEPVFGSSGLEVDVVVTSDPVALAAPGRLGLAPWGSPLVADFEDAGIPVHPIALPDPFLARPDGERWETVDASACLP